MTIGVGFSLNDGVVVIASDSQVTVQGYTKTHEGKSRVVIFKNGNVLCFSGAGSGEYIRTAIEKAISGIGNITDFTKMHETLELNLLDFFQKHLAPWAYYPQHERPDVELLIGLSMRNGPTSLFHYSGTSFSRVSGDQSIGAGSLIADSLIDELEISASTGADKAAVIAAYILYKVKAQVDSCGGFTSLWVLRPNGDFAGPNMKIEDDLEGMFKKLDEERFSDFKKKLGGLDTKLNWSSQYRKKKSN
jgi:hypothetical protein